MRFAAVIVPSKPSQRAPAAELLRRLMAGEPLARSPLSEPLPQDLPVELDQRVRLIGEW